MNNQTIDVIEKRDIDRIFLSITIISQQIFFNDGNGYIYKRNIDILIGCNINNVPIITYTFICSSFYLQINIHIFLIFRN